MDTIKHYSNFPATGVSLRQMVQFGEKPSTGTLFRASQFLSEELPIRLAHRVQELNDLPDGLNEMPSICRVRDWYAQSFEELVQLPRPNLSSDIKERLLKPAKRNGKDQALMGKATQNPSIKQGQYRSAPENGNGNGNGSREVKGATSSRRYYAAADDGQEWPPELSAYNTQFADTLEKIKRRHDSVVTTVAQGILEWKRKRQRMRLTITSRLSSTGFTCLVSAFACS